MPVIAVTAIGDTIIDSMEFRSLLHMNEVNKRSSIRARSTGCRAKPALYEIYNSDVHDKMVPGTFYAHRSFVTPNPCNAQGNILPHPSPIFDK